VRKVLDGARINFLLLIPADLAEKRVKFKEEPPSPPRSAASRKNNKFKDRILIGYERERDSTEMERSELSFLFVPKKFLGRSTTVFLLSFIRSDVHMPRHYSTYFP